MLKTVKNEARCDFTEVAHVLPVKDCCPVSHNPSSGLIKIQYEPNDVILEVAHLRAYVDSYRGGKGEIRSMEGMIQAIAQDCANTVRVCIRLDAELAIIPNQEMKLKCVAFPQEKGPEEHSLSGTAN